MVEVSNFRGAGRVEAATVRKIDARKIYARKMFAFNDALDERNR
jgi:hypothetical protein